MSLPGPTPIFTIGELTFDWADVRIAAALWGDWERAERRTREGLASLRFLEADESEIDPTVIEAAADGFRQERNLLAAAEMNEWLERRALDGGDWLAFIERDVARQRCSAELDAIVGGYPVEDGEVLEAAECEAICSGIILASVRKLAAAAAFAGSRADDWETTADRCPELDLQRLAIRDVDPHSARSRAGRIFALRAVFEEFEASVMTDEHCERLIASRALDWTVIDCRRASFTDDDSAHEAVFCIRDEGQDLGEVAASAGSREERSRFFLEDLELQTQQQFLSAAKGALVGPVVLGGLPTIAIVLDKLRPSLEDPEVRARAAERLREAAIERAASAARFFLEP
jgi:hypothetical protein